LLPYELLLVLDLELGIAPNLLSNIQTLVSGGKISNQGTFNNVDPAVIGLGVPRLHAEESQNIATGITFRSGLISLRRSILPYKSKRSCIVFWRLV
jgi:hypothetical protein